MKKKQLSLFQLDVRKQAVLYVYEGCKNLLSFSEIGQIFGVPKQTIHLIIKNKK